MVFFRRVLLLAFLAIASAPLVRADSPTVTAVLTSSETEVDRPVQLQIKVTGDSNATPPNDIAVDGLDIRYSGQSQLVEGRNFAVHLQFHLQLYDPPAQGRNLHHSGAGQCTRAAAHCAPRRSP